MRWLANAAILSATVTCMACADHRPAAPRIDGVTPASTAQGTAADVTIAGAFYVDVGLDFSGGGGHLGSRFTARLAVPGGPPIDLAEVRYVDQGALNATVPDTLAAGVYDLTVVDPAGRAGVAPGAFTVLSGQPADAGVADAGDGGPPDTNTPPRADVSCSPPAVVVGTMVSCSGAETSDLEDAQSALTYDWDWQGDGVFDSSGYGASHTFTTAGEHTIVIRVTDTGGLVDYDSFVEVVDVPANLLTVTTGVDESDAGATPAAPGGTGLSLREAILYADATAGQQTIYVPGGTMMAMTGSMAVPSQSAGITLVGDGAIWDGSGVAGDCWAGAMSNLHVFGMHWMSCPLEPINLTGGAGNQISRVFFEQNGAGPTLLANGTFGPHNLSYTNGTGVVVGGSVQVLDNELVVNATGVHVIAGGNGSVVRRNVIQANTIGVLVDSGVPGVMVQHNTIALSSSHAVQLAAGGSSLDLRNNIFTANGGFGVVGATAGFAALDGNDFFMNSAGDCSGCTPGPNSLFVDPLLIAPVTGDFRFQPASPMRDRGQDLGIDVNGPAPGNFLGAAPDLGAWESPY